MKKSLLALAALSLFAGAASAQSSVTLFGIVDLSLKSTKNGSVTQKTMGSDGINSSRLGFRGVEDLGGGLKAAFHLEAGLDAGVGTVGGGNGVQANAPGVTTGQPNVGSLSGPASFFNRRSTVSLLGNFGEVRLGRDYTASFWNETIFDPFGTNGVGSSGNLLNGLGGQIGSGNGTTVRGNNIVGYFLPSGLGGLYGQVQIAPSENINGQKYAGGRVGWAAGPVDVAVAYGQTESLVATGDKFKLFDIGASYDLGVVKLMGQFINEKYLARKQRNWLIGAVVPLGQGELHASYVDADQKGAGTDKNDAKQFALGYVYNLSKRSAVYATAARISNDGAQAFSVGGPGSAAGKDSTGYEFGLRHSF